MGGGGLPCGHRLPQPIRKKGARRDAHDGATGVAVDHGGPIPGLTEVESAQCFHRGAAVSPHIRVMQPRQPTGEDRRLQLLCTLAGRTIEGPGKLQGHLGVIGDGQPFGQVRTPQVHQR